MSKLLRSLLQDTSGATAAEYCLMAALIALAIVATVSLLGETLRDKFQDPEISGALN